MSLGLGEAEGQGLECSTHFLCSGETPEGHPGGTTSGPAGRTQLKPLEAEAESGAVELRRREGERTGSWLWELHA